MSQNTSEQALLASGWNASSDGMVAWISYSLGFLTRTTYMYLWVGDFLTLLKARALRRHTALRDDYEFGAA